MAEKIRNTNRFTPTMPAPVGIEYTQESISPTQKQPTEMIAEDSVTERKRENMRMEDSAGNTIRLEINSVPIMRMPMTTVIAVSMAISIL